MSKTSRGLGRSLVRRLCYRSTIGLAVLTFCTFLPLFSFGGFKARIKYFSSVGSTNVTYVQSSDLPDETALYFAYYNSTFGLCLNHSNLYSPNVGTSTAAWSVILNNQIDPLGGNSFTNSPAHFPRVWDLFVSAQSLINSGYNGTGITLVFSGSRVCYNVNFPVLVSDILSSTNTTYRQIILSHLSSIQASVQNIELNVSGLQSSIDEGNNILSNVSDNVVSISENVDSISADVHSYGDILSDINFSASSTAFNSSNLVSSLDVLRSDFAMNNLEVFLGDDTKTWVDFLNLCQSSGLLSSSDVASYISELQATDPTRTKSYSIPMQHRRFYVKNQIKHTCVEAQKLRGRYQSFDTQFGDLNSPVFRSIHNIAQSQFVYPLSSNFATTIGDWRTELRQDLQDWKTSDRTGYLNTRDFQRKNFEPPYGGSNTNSMPFYSFITNNVTVPVSNSVQQAGNQISSNIVEQSKATRDFLDEKFSNGIDVRVVFPLYQRDNEMVNVHDENLEELKYTMRVFSDNFDEYVADFNDGFGRLSSLTNSFDWSPWFDKWDPFSDTVSNYYSEFNSSVPSSGIAADFLERGFDEDRYSSLPWFQRVEVLLAMIADVRSNSVAVADISDDMQQQVDNFQSLSTNVVLASSDVVGLFGYVQRFSTSLESVFGDRAAPLTGDYVLLSSGHWIGDEPLVLRINPTIQGLCRLIMQCIWYLGFLVLLWIVVNWCWQKVVAVLRWLWSMFDV